MHRFSRSRLVRPLSLGLSFQRFKPNVAATLLLTALSGAAAAQLTPADYTRALNLQEKYRGLVSHMPDRLQWLEGTDRFVYRRTIPGGHEFIMVDAETRAMKPAFDHARLAEALSKALDEPIKPEALPLEDLKLQPDSASLNFMHGDDRWRCDLTAYTCAKLPAPKREPIAEDDGGYDSTPPAVNGASHGVPSPDGKWLAFIENYNVAIRPAHLKPDDAERQTILLSEDGSEGDYYAVQTLAWSPDAKHLAAYRIRPGYRRLIHYVESSPADQLQPKSSTMVYPKPGDVLSLYQPVLFQIDAKQEVPIDNALFPNPYEMLPFKWWNDSRAFTFEYNQRGHQLYRLIEVDAATGKPRTLIEETSQTFINYEDLTRNQFDHGKRYRHDIDDGKEILWASERDGWEHLYLFNGRTGALERQITHGDWVVRAVDRVDDANREIYFEASGMNPDEDPYYVHGYKLHFDGTGLTPLSPVEADHILSYSPDGKYFVDTYSRLDLPPVMELHRAADASLVMTVDKADDTQLKAAGWHPAEPFHTAGRDGNTQIWGIIYKPANFNPLKKYPVVEDIYAGPQGSFVPKSFSARAEPLTELGFVVVQIDGMGTNNRSRAFHDVAWRNLKDAGFPDRILWHRAVAAKYPWYDISHGVGIFGTSAGGQSAMGALLFHPEFYKVAVANSGSHDNRMDKIWWNEQWMGWPIGPWYSESSNVDNAWRLQGKLLLVMGEMDKNVDPSTTLQVVDRLIKAGKDFDFLFVPGGGHGAGGRYGERRLLDFFVRNLLHEPTPDWNSLPETNKDTSGNKL
ncbi:MAG TPA: DPP IV N-terminal domain-containing protein [Terracidiphilus sp.]|nr:DPP IV N-terminal domain-containing protein [Terracidiphilus sp.]